MNSENSGMIANFQINYDTLKIYFQNYSYFKYYSFMIGQCRESRQKRKIRTIKLSGLTKLK